MWGIVARGTRVWEGRLISPAPRGRHVPTMVSDVWQRSHHLRPDSRPSHLAHSHTFSTGTRDAAAFPATSTNTKRGQAPVSNISTHHTTGKGKGRKHTSSKRTVNPVSLGVHNMEDSEVSGSVEGEDEFERRGHSDLSDGAMSYNESGQETEDELMTTISSGIASKPKHNLKSALAKQVSCMVMHRRPLY